MPATIRRSAQNSNIYRAYGILSSYRGDLSSCLSRVLFAIYLGAIAIGAAGASERERPVAGTFYCRWSCRLGSRYWFRYSNRCS